jgi:hypothetical protein
VKVEKLITLGCLGTLELVPLGCLGALDGWWCRGAQSLWWKAPGQASGSAIRLWRLPRAICTGTGDRPQGLPKCSGSVTAPKGCHLYGFGDRPQGSLSGITASCIVRGREEITVALVASWGALCLHTALTETYFLERERNSGNTSSSPPAPLLVTSCLYFLQVNLCCILYLLVCLSLLHHIGCLPIWCLVLIGKDYW